MIRPTFKTGTLAALTLPLQAAAAHFWPEQWYFGLYGPLAVLVLLALDLRRTLPARLIELEWELPKTFYVGRPGTLAVKIQAPGRLRLEAALELEGPVPVPELKTVRLPEEPSPAWEVTPGRRGIMTVKALWLRWRGPWGLCEIRRLFPAGLRLEAVQDIHNIHQEALSFFREQTLFGPKTQPFRGEGSEFDCLTDFAPGMDNRHIDWKHTARHLKLLAREFRQERNHQIVLGFDTGRLMQDPAGRLTKLDHFIASALRLALVGLKSGDLVGSCGYDLTFHSFLKPSRGPIFFPRLQAFTASLNYSLLETNHTLAMAELMIRLPHRSLIVLFTEFIDEISAELLIESLHLLTRRHMVIFVTAADPLLAALEAKRPQSCLDLASAVLAGRFATTREIVLERITRLGVHCLEAPSGQITAALLNRYLLIKQRGLL